MSPEVYNESLNAKESSAASLTASINDLSEYRNRVLGVQTYDELVKETQIFLSNSNVSSDDYNAITSMLNDEVLKNDVDSLKTNIDAYLSEIIESNTKTSMQADEALKNEQQKVADDIVRTLEDSGITVRGGVDVVQEQIANGELTGQDIEKIQQNVEAVAGSYAEKGEVIEVNNVELTGDQIVEAKNEEQLQNYAEISEQALSDTPNTVSIDNDGNISMVGENSDQSINFTAMLMALLITSSYNNGVSLGLNFDAKLVKQASQKSQFDVVFGDFKNNSNKLNTDIINMFNEQVKSFNPNVNYLDVLKNSAPELATSLEILQGHVLGQEGEFKMAIKNNGDSRDIAFSLDENYQEIADCFRNSGAMMTNDTNEKSIIRVSNDSVFTMINTLENLNANAKEKEGNSKSNNIVFIKKMDEQNLGNAARINTTFLAIIAAAEVILVGFLISFIR